LATDIVVTYEESTGKSVSGNVSLNFAGGSQTTHNNVRVEHSLHQIYCKECGRTYLITHKKNELNEISAFVKNAKNNTSEEELDQILNKINRAELDFADFPKYIYVCTKIIDLSWKDKIKRYIKKVETYNVFIAVGQNRYLLVLRRIKGQKVKLSDFYLMERSDYEF